MKFLIALSVLASSSVFADVTVPTYINCYDTPQQNGAQTLEYRFAVRGETISLDYPTVIPLSIVAGGSEESGGFECLQPTPAATPLLICQAEGQRIRGLIPVDVGDEPTYCQPAILDWISGIPGPTVN